MWVIGSMLLRKLGLTSYSLNEWICHHLPRFCGFWRPSHKGMILVVLSINSNELRPTTSWHGNGVSFNCFVFIHRKLKTFHCRLMIITGVITLVTSVVFWQVLIFNKLIDWCQERFGFYRFFFPDSPTTAWFLTPEERTLAVQRIKVNQSGVENKHWKREQWVWYMRKSAILG